MGQGALPSSPAAESDLDASPSLQDTSSNYYAMCTSIGSEHLQVLYTRPKEQAVADSEVAKEL